MLATMSCKNWYALVPACAAVLHAGKRYRLTEYLHALAITAGCTVFVLGGDPSSRLVEDK